MSIHKVIGNRRECRRHKVREGTFAVIRTEPDNSSRLGTIVDISKGGLAFHFIDTKGGYPDFSELDIFISGNGMLMGHIPIKIISEITMTKEIPFYSDLKYLYEKSSFKK